MMKKDQLKLNELIKSAYSVIMKELDENNKWIEGERLLNCQAYVFETDNYYVLKSYSTFVAAIRKDSDVCIDFLRYVYGYTATSAQHIAKFRKARCFGGYGSGEWGCKETYTYREV